MKSVNTTQFDVEPGKLDLFIFREFEAPRELVFKAYTNPKLYVEWMGPRELTTKLEKFEPRVGGRWSYISKDKEGREFGFHGVYHEVLEPERIIGTFEYDGLPEKGHVVLDTVKFESLPLERTRIVTHDVFLSVEDRDGMIQADMKRGVIESFERLDEVLETEKVKYRAKVRIS
jgi:uncharacterized protein YndB with AHSA1/START domain